MMAEIHTAMTESGEIARIEELHGAVAELDHRIETETESDGWLRVLQRSRLSIIAEIDARVSEYALRIAGA